MRLNAPPQLRVEHAVEVSTQLVLCPLAGHFKRIIIHCVVRHLMVAIVAGIALSLDRSRLIV
jgi:hypothetical protein